MTKIIDAQKTIDTLKLRFYNEYLYTNHIYDEGESGYHKEITKQVVKDYIDPLNLPVHSVILDLGCGPGYFLDEMYDRGYTDVTGVTLSPGDIETCVNKGHKVKQYDLSFLPQSDGYHDESVDFIFLRHALEHSPYPIFSLMEYNRVLKQHGKIYIEVPAPGCERKHEHNPNHYSILGAEMLAALLHRTGFNIDDFRIFEFKLNLPAQNNTYKEVTETFYCIIATKDRPLDVK
jgi:SAM-dependent methyltransferase